MNRIPKIFLEWTESIILNIYVELHTIHECNNLTFFNPQYPKYQENLHSMHKMRSRLTFHDIIV